ncbi:hypothetical protein HL658_07665 [Azospirillum sp. RWY-5-1]|uniref:DUF86 domain-containing protein n=1 Tax=Azospirillum oleiclasticum TaxID=2735135 RepID=A0ABX2T8Q4_9PROT|nr:hypothetical protein [Azospirillum oleiclasticum]NYZ12423.1 hypothetical protein [Azospirillum oleiclasticum]NYZ19583.1 hypothetical protein [Azospirillum oleiclasticum]
MNPGELPAFYLARNLRSSERVAARLDRLCRDLAPLFPLTAVSVDGLPEDSVVRLDAFVKRFEQLQSTLAEGVFRGIALVEGYDPATLSRRDLADLMEKLGALASSARWTAITLLRNRLAHAYPEEPDTQAARLNEAFAATPDLLAAAAAAHRYVVAKGRVPLGGDGGPVP